MPLDQRYGIQCMFSFKVNSRKTKWCLKRWRHHLCLNICLLHDDRDVSVRKQRTWINSQGRSDFLTFGASDGGFQLFVSNLSPEEKCRSWQLCSLVIEDSRGFIPDPHVSMPGYVTGPSFDRSRCCRRWPVLKPEDQTPHDSSICCMHSHRLPLIHLKTVVVLYVYTVKPSEFSKPLVPYFIQDQKICMHCCSFKGIFIYF